MANWNIQRYSARASIYSENTHGKTRNAICIRRRSPSASAIISRNPQSSWLRIWGADQSDLLSPETGRIISVGVQGQPSIARSVLGLVSPVVAASPVDQLPPLISKEIASHSSSAQLLGLVRSAIGITSVQILPFGGRGKSRVSKKMRIPAIKVNQWLTEWDDYKFRPEDRQRKPESYFYVSSIPLEILRRLSNVPRRGEETETGQQHATGPRVEDIGIQRGFEERRADDIRDFMRAGYPWATLPKREQDRFTGLKKPGWLPTSLVVNIVKTKLLLARKSPLTSKI